MRSFPVFAASILGGIASTQAQASGATDDLASVFGSLTAHTALSTGWKSCNGTMECNRLEVPLDYSKPSGKKATIALTRSSGKGSDGKKKTYLINPGGPGLSGTSTIVDPQYLKLFRAYLGEEHDIIGWDPRGVGFSTPNITCLDTQEGFAWWAEYNGLFSAGTNTLPEQWAALKSLSETCEYTSGGEDGITRHSSSATNARDMKAIVEAIDGKDAVLNFYGLSYGTVYGMTFASMFPEKVGSVILDGNADPAGFFKESTTPEELVDGPKVVEAFYTECAKAGPSKCSFYQKNPKDIEKALNAILAKLDKEPMSGTYLSTFTGLPTPFIVTRTVLENIIFECTYDPRDTFHYLADVLALLSTGNVTGTGLLSDHVWPIIPDIERQFEAEINGLCADFQIYKKDIDLKGIQANSKLLGTKSPMAQAQWTTLDMACRTWPAKSAELFRGPYGPGKGNKTKGKMLFVNNKYDPVTPLANADHYSKVFGGGLLTINGIGHTTLTTYSECSAGVVQAFVKDGTLPAKGKICDMEGDLFPSPESASGSA